MHPYVIERMVQERREELARMAGADGVAHAARGERGAGRWATAVRGLTALATAAVVRIARRPEARPTPALEPCGGATGRPC